ncbi:MAG: hypothetical protein QGG10_09335, partial [Arenicellales bacterium]|nr:hypothetical protein [Arenicellales bacterium]
WTDPDDAELFSYAKKNEWGTGDYGTFSLGVYNGQGLADEVNDQKHISARFTKPFTICDGNYAEAGASYYGGSFYPGLPIWNWAPRRWLSSQLFAAVLHHPGSRNLHMRLWDPRSAGSAARLGGLWTSYSLRSWTAGVTAPPYRGHPHQL